MSDGGLAQFLARVSQEPALQAQLRGCSPVEAAELARELGHSVRVGDLLRYESRAFAWQLTDAEYELVVRLVRQRRHWWQHCWPQVADPAPDPAASPLSTSV